MVYPYRGFVKYDNGDEEINLNGNYIKGRWVEGYYVHSVPSLDLPNRPHIIVTTKFTGDKEMIMCDWDVIPNTVCRNTYMLSSDGQCIFENDIVKWTWFTGRVVYENDTGRFVAVDNAGKLVDFVDYESRNCKIIGRCL